MSARVTCLVVGPLPPPLHGFSAVTAAVVDAFQAAGISTWAIDTANGQATEGGLSAAHSRLLAIAKLLLALMIRRPAVVYVALSGGRGQVFDVLAAFTARAFRCRILFHHHSYSYLDRRSAITQLLVAAGGKQATHIVLCEEMAQQLREIYPRAIRMLVISNAAFLRTSAPAPPAEALRTLGFLSNITIEKGIERFIALLTHVRKSAPHISAQVAGPVTDPQARPLIDRAIAERTIEYRGAVYGADKEAFLARIDALVFPSIYPNECQPLVILEALRAGVPVIATDRGCIPSMIEEPSGFLIDRNAEDLAPAAARLQRWIEYPAEFASARKAARQQFERAARDGERALRDLTTIVLAGGNRTS
jgi:glycosyltransferase involved in cell wall biosynthesis